MSGPARRSLSEAFMRVAGPLMMAAVVVAGVVFAAGLVGMQRRSQDLPPATVAELRVFRPAAFVQWRGVRGALERRLDQHGALEFGAVWRMRGGRICGVVNGKGSFGGWSGMTAFHADGAALSFDDGDPPFQQAWVECRRDHWIDLVQGSQARGACASRTSRRACTYLKVE